MRGRAEVLESLLYNGGGGATIRTTWSSLLRYTRPHREPVWSGNGLIHELFYSHW